MSRSYYVIELSARWLTVLLAVLALLMVVAFVLGYAAAWTATGEVVDPGPVVSTPTPEIEEVVIDDSETPVGVSPTTALATTGTPTPKALPETPVPATPQATRIVATELPQPSATPRPAEPKIQGFWVQVLASSKQSSIDDARAKVSELGFDRDHQRVVRTEVAGGNTLHKLRVGPFPDRASADRVLLRLRSAGFPDAWVVVPNYESS